MPPSISQGNEDFYRPPGNEGGKAIASQGNGMAVASLVCGVLCCVTPIPPILAIAFGIIALRKARDPYVSGRGMAATGIALGLAALIIWVIAGTGMGFLVRYILQEKDQAEKTAETFVQRVVDGKIDEAMAMALPGVDRKKLLEVSERTKPWGPLSYLRVDYKPDQAPPTPENSIRFRWLIEGSAVFARASPEISLSVVKAGDVYKVERFDLR